MNIYAYIFVACGFGIIAGGIWFVIWRGATKKILPNLGRGTTFSIQEGSFRFWATFCYFVGVALLASCILVMILIPKEFMLIRIILLKSGFLMWLLCSFVLGAYAVVEPFREERYKRSTFLNRLGYIILSEFFCIIFWGVQILIVIYVMFEFY